MTDHQRENDLVEIVTTVANEEDAARIARALVLEKSFACASWRPVRSIYSWQGALWDEGEVEITFKTLAACAEHAEQRLRALHPYETPAILRVPILHANSDYADWVRSNVNAKGD
ncbi:MAG TPA: divalent-cation tolerance protein CutA [bacterium]|nr:divalent-cation tolerance protein CutA [bacterium]